MNQEDMQEKLKDMSPEEIQKLQKQNCIFCHIIEGKVPSKKIHEDEICLAILDINPANPGHILLLPKEHYMIMPQVPEGTMAHLAIIAKQLSSACLKAFKCDGTNIFVANGSAAGQKAQHFMIHIIPRFEKDGVKIQITENTVNKSDLMKVKEIIQGKINIAFNIKETERKEISEDPQLNSENREPEETIPKEIEPQETTLDQEFENAEKKMKETEDLLNSLKGKNNLPHNSNTSEDEGETEDEKENKGRHIQEDDETNIPNRQNPSSQEKSESRTQSTKPKGGKEVNLDDIASLFG